MSKYILASLFPRAPFPCHVVSWPRQGRHLRKHGKAFFFELKNGLFFFVLSQTLLTIISNSFLEENSGVHPRWVEIISRAKSSDSSVLLGEDSTSHPWEKPRVAYDCILAWLPCSPQQGICICILYLCQVSLNRLRLCHVAPSGRRIEVSSALARLRDYRGAYQSHMEWLFPSRRARVKVPLQPQKWLCSLTSDRSPPSSPPVFHESVHKSWQVASLSRGGEHFPSSTHGCMVCLCTWKFMLRSSLILPFFLWFLSPRFEGFEDV